VKSFDKKYWELNYSEPETMDCIGNAKEHTQYIKSFFELELIDVSSIIDLGCGYGYLFQKMLKAFLPYKACAIEPSKHALDKARSRKLKPVESTELILLNESINSWCCDRADSPKLRYDLAICTSVFQYLPEKDLKIILPILARRVKFFYLTVPTDKELDRQIEDLDFDDTYAKRRTRQFYRKLMNENFTNISSKLWESKFYFTEDTTLFTDLLYRT
jgi:SAM-dependent methyltransferase